jgi:hypothetical protein
MTRLPLKPLLIAGAALAIAAPAASADSIVYIDHGNVFSARPDGSGKVQLTDGGQWHSPTQADDGTIAAVQGTGPITVMARDGRVLRTITTPSAKSGDGGTFAPRPVDLSFSPDGSKIAYSYVANSCPAGSTCGVVQRSTFYTRADASPDATPISTWGNQFSVSDPEWVTNDRTLVFGGATHMVNFDDLDSGEDYNYKHWFDGAEDTGDGELSRDGSRLATTYSYGANLKMFFYKVTGDVKTSIPTATYSCRFDTPDPNFGDPSWSPDGQKVAFQDSDGIEVIGFSTMDAGVDYGGTGCTSTGPSKVIAPGATEPDWGPADPPAARYLPPAGGQPQPGTTTTTTTPGPAGTGKPGTGTGAGTGGPALALRVDGAARQRFRGALAIACRASAATTCKAVAAVKVGKRTYTSKPATAAVKGGTAKALKLTFSRAATKAIKQALRHRRLKATVTLTAGGATTTRAITLRR